jgi:perosamine synthetase
MAGSIGTIGCFSFFPNKLITTGEGGMVITHSEPIADRIRSLRNQAAIGGTYHFSEMGFNYRMTNLQAAVGLAQMERIQQFIQKREEVIGFYNQALDRRDGITLFHEPGWSKNGCWLFSALIQGGSGMERDQLIAGLKQQGIESKPFFDLQTNVVPYRTAELFPVAQDLSARGINLPTGMCLNQEMIEEIAGLVVSNLAAIHPKKLK